MGRIAIPALVLALVAVVASLRAAPALKPVAPEAPDHLTGPLARRLDSPVLVIPAADGTEAVYWLVFADQATESAALAGLEPGDRVTVRGRFGTGGAFRYFAVSALIKDE